MDVLKAANARAAAGEAVVHLEAGEPGGETPAAVRAAAEAALSTGRLGYTEPLGMPSLRARIAAFYGERYGITVSAERVIVTAGASAGFILGFLALFDPGERVALAEPGYPAYRNILSVLGLEPVALACEPATGYQPTPAHLASATPLAGLIIQSPANPTGAMLDAPSLAALSRTCAARGIRLISDEIYHGITYGAPAETALAHSPDAVVINSFSKYFCMTGWRIGWMIVPEVLVRPIERLAQNLFISPNALSQYAALAAFDARDELDRRVQAYGRNRGRLLGALARSGLRRVAPPQGAFYLYADISNLTNDSERFAADMLAECGVAATPGTDFDRARGVRTLRFSFAGSEEAIADASSRLERWLAARRAR